MDRTTTLPQSPEALAASEIFKRWWYFSVELLPGMATKGHYPPDLPMLPRIMLRRCDVRGASCLDMGTVEGLIPVLMCRGGAQDVLAIDINDDHVERLRAVQHYHAAPFDYQSTGLMYGLADKLGTRSFDLINCSGLLYHVFSPMLLLAGLRALLKRDGLLIVSTNVICEPGFFMEFNNGGRMQLEGTTYWYLSVQVLDYILRYLGLAPIDCIFLPHDAFGGDYKYAFGRPSGYLSVVCKAATQPVASDDDNWMRRFAPIALEGQTVNWDRVRQAPPSQATYRGEMDANLRRSDTGEIACIDLWQAVQSAMARPPRVAADARDTHLLRLSDRS